MGWQEDYVTGRVAAFWRGMEADGVGESTRIEQCRGTVDVLLKELVDTVAVGVTVHLSHGGERAFWQPMDEAPAAPPAPPAAAPFEDDECTCVEFCDEDPASACSLSGQPHVHPASQGPGFGPCPEHPERPGDH